MKTALCLAGKGYQTEGRIGGLYILAVSDCLLIQQAIAYRLINYHLVPTGFLRGG